MPDPAPSVLFLDIPQGRHLHREAAAGYGTIGAALQRRAPRSTDWIRGAERRGIDLNDYPAVKRWHDAMAARPAVQRGVAVLAEHQRRGQITDAERENYFGKTQFQAR
jgi:hypothetical protein